MSSTPKDLTPYVLDPLIARATVFYSATIPAFFDRVGRDADPERFKSKHAQRVMSAIHAVARANGDRGPSNVALVHQHMKVQCESEGRGTFEDFKAAQEWLDASEERDLPEPREVHIAVAPIIAADLRSQATYATIEAHAHKADNAKAVELEQRALRVLLPLLLDPEEDAPAWPAPMAEEAFHGPAGAIVRRIEPHTESDRQALLLTTLTMFGNAVGPDPHFMVEATEHGANLFALIVGGSSNGRKGTAVGHPRRFMKDADPAWSERCVHAGLRTGEGIVRFFCPPPPKKAKGGEEEETDERDELGTPDRRAMFIEPEYGTTLRVAQRDGCTLSQVIRQCYDRDTLEVLTKVEPMRAEGTHVSIIGQITPSELRQQLGATDLTNGYVNRFLICLVKRSKLLPFGSELPDAERAELVDDLRAPLNHARGVTRVERDDAARALWAEVYPQLCPDGDADDVVDSVIARGPAHVVRLSLIYALLDCSNVIRVEHIRAALAVWKYCEASARFLFGGAAAATLDGRVLRLLQAAPAGLSKTELYAGLAGHVRADELASVLGRLERKGTIRSEEVRTRGRPQTRYFAKEVRKAKKAPGRSTPATSHSSHSSHPKKTTNGAPKASGETPGAPASSDPEGSAA